MIYDEFKYSFLVEIVLIYIYVIKRDPYTFAIGKTTLPKRLDVLLRRSASGYLLYTHDGHLTTYHDLSVF